jgi:hypothetical protein
MKSKSNSKHPQLQKQEKGLRSSKETVSSFKLYTNYELMLKLYAIRKREASIRKEAKLSSSIHSTSDNDSTKHRFSIWACIVPIIDVGLFFLR